MSSTRSFPSLASSVFLFFFYFPATLTLSGGYYQGIVGIRLIIRLLELFYFSGKVAFGRFLVWPFIGLTFLLKKEKKNKTTVSVLLCCMKTEVSHSRRSTNNNSKQQYLHMAINFSVARRISCGRRRAPKTCRHCTATPPSRAQPLPITSSRRSVSS